MTNFPNTILKIPIGWEKLGKKGTFDKDGREMYHSHTFCGTRVCIGREDNVRFVYCPRCLVNID